MNKKRTVSVYPTPAKIRKLINTHLDATQSKTRVTKIVEITDISKVSHIHPRIKKITEILDTPELPVNTIDQALKA